MKMLCNLINTHKYETSEMCSVLNRKKTEKKILKEYATKNSLKVFYFLLLLFDFFY